MATPRPACSARLGYDAVNLDGGWLTWRDAQASLTREPAPASAA
ncbi:hypothetical protein [Demequina litorisediminis]